MDLRTGIESFRRLKGAYDLLVNARKSAEATAMSFNRFMSGSTEAFVGVGMIDAAIEKQKEALAAFLNEIVEADDFEYQGDELRDVLSVLGAAEQVFGLKDGNPVVRLAAKIGAVFAPFVKPIEIDA